MISYTNVYNTYGAVVCNYQNEYIIAIATCMTCHPQEFYYTCNAV